MTVKRVMAPQLLEPQEVRQRIRRGSCRGAKGPTTSSPRDNQTACLYQTGSISGNLCRGASRASRIKPGEAWLFQKPLGSRRRQAARSMCLWVIVTQVAVSRTVDDVIR